MHLRYCGTKYHGWQRQANARSVQEEIEHSLSTILQERIQCHGCGRTDAGVHASQYVLHFDVVQKLDQSLLSRLNKFIAKDIIVYELQPVADSANAQTDVLHRTYRYFIHTAPSPFIQGVSTFYPEKKFEIGIIEKALQLLMGKNDFGAFCLQPALYKHTICNLVSAEVKCNLDLTQLYFEFTADRFLRGMIRHLVHGLMELARSSMSFADFSTALHSGKPYDNRRQAYPQGLHLSRVTYAYIDFTPEPLTIGTLG